MASRFDIGLVCSVGVGAARGGRASNQDNYLVCRDGEVRWRDGEGEHIEPVGGHGLLLAVADGMGGHDHGDVASGAAVRAVARLYSKGLPAHPETTLRKWLLRSHRRLHERARDSGASNMGTTLTVAWVLGRHVYWAHVGDSRLYHVRGDSLKRLTQDHTRAEFARRDGRRDPPDSHFLSQSYVFGSRGLGDDHEIRIDPGVDTGHLRLSVGDSLLLCTDGLSARVPDHRVRDALREKMASGDCAVWLVQRAIAAGSDDNLTALVVRVEALDEKLAVGEDLAPWDEVSPRRAADLEVSKSDLARWEDRADALFVKEHLSDELVPDDDP